MKKTIDVLGVSFIYTTLAEFIAKLCEYANKGEKKFIITANPEIVMLARENEEFRELIQQADYVSADGIGIVKGAAMLGTPLPERVSGYDTLLGILRTSNETKRSIYMLGAKEEVLEQAVVRIRHDYPNVCIAGYHHGFFDWEDDSIIKEIQETEPDFIFVGLGAPRQEKWIHHHLHMVEKGVFMGVGGSFDGIAGKMKRAPKIWRNLHLEWLYRLFKQPSRWRRMLALPRFVLEVRKEKRRRKNR
ncbi:WecB/TagA/CpsF family glycosyltransferase [Priestia taiwanensis]|uniref:N-acetylglucosaminyldiphosphoundecaprenol N-acetyl-beta-D-mannosaminyltransferase n=1 Tax=Priestia taiwanensis TaxID=1347902 RepID=A0A917AWU0_9BACI|nr:WecB/TagA/CpsF family glycosyltransferase [Priestia taiwanensis]MBM7364359.1 N-acetylglucosaminyldiphosphoundecaprenol N-acetyl-beta-D-mannosaminyltransferase [Priestia taiwanensis]GGE85054.1 acetylglucosaminyldiphosphoundecaprenol acetyl-beta-D-mannosaminyltransferase [Priestia taiwanensis]